MLSDVWPSPDEVRAVIDATVDPALFRETYAVVFEGDEHGARCRSRGDRYAWDDASTYIASPPFFDGLTAEPARSRTSSARGRSRSSATR